MEKKIVNTTALNADHISTADFRNSWVNNMEALTGKARAMVTPIPRVKALIPCWRYNRIAVSYIVLLLLDILVLEFELELLPLSPSLTWIFDFMTSNG